MSKWTNRLKHKEVTPQVRYDQLTSISMRLLEVSKTVHKDAEGIILEIVAELACMRDKEQTGGRK